MKMALSVQPEPGAPEYVNVLASWGWIPADLMPGTIASSDAKVIARRIRQDEAQALRNQMLSQESRLEQQLREADSPVIKLGASGAVTQRIYVDIAWEVLRAEFGWGDRSMDPHWRPALETMMSHVPEAMTHFVQYLQDGKAVWFDIDDDGTVGWGKVRTGIGFQEKLMPHIKKGMGK